MLFATELSAAEAPLSLKRGTAANHAVRVKLKYPNTFAFSRFIFLYISVRSCLFFISEMLGLGDDILILCFRHFRIKNTNRINTTQTRKNRKMWHLTKLS